MGPAAMEIKLSELEKMRQSQNASHVLTAFIDWMYENGYAVCRWQDLTRHSDEIGDLSPEGWFPKHNSHEQLLADFFDIDMKKVEEERRVLLESIREKK